MNITLKNIESILENNENLCLYGRNKFNKEKNIVQYIADRNDLKSELSISQINRVLSLFESVEIKNKNSIEIQKLLKLKKIPLGRIEIARLYYLSENEDSKAKKKEKKYKKDEEFNDILSNSEEFTPED